LEYHPDILERIAEQSRTYKAQALISRAALEMYQSNFERALYFYTEALKTNPTVSDFVHISTGIASVKSMEGFNASALADLEKLLPVLRYAEPLTRLITVNSYAVELSESNRLTEAQTVSLVAMSSPLAPFYPESQDTLSEIRSKEKRRSTIAISRPRIEQEYESESEVPENVIRKARTEAVIDFMNANLHRRITLPELAEVVNLSPSHFSRLFNDEMRISPVAYLIRLRLEKAAKLLVTSFLSVKQVMASVGYGSRHSFSYHFKKQFGLTPSDYRKRFFHQR